MPDPLPFERRLHAVWPPPRWLEGGVLIALSGGPDSVALTAALAAIAAAESPAGANWHLTTAHFNHRLRGEASDADERFAVEIAARFHLTCVVDRGDVVTTAAERGDGVEEAARHARYHFLTATAKRLGLRHIVTAHTLDDQAETVLHRILRGTGLGGLGGIQRARPLAGGTIGLVRPLLEARAEVMEYLEARGLPYRIDASNDDLRYTRNRLRHELLPQLARDYNPQIVEALARLALQADERNEFMARMVVSLSDAALMRNDATGCELDCTAFRRRSRHEVRETLVSLWKDCDLPQQGMGYHEWNVLADLATDDTPRTVDLPAQSAQHASSISCDSHASVFLSEPPG